MFSLILKKIKEVQICHSGFGLGLAKFLYSSHAGCSTRFLHVHKWSKNLDCYFKSGRIWDADRLFEEMPDRNVVVWSIMVHGYAKNGLLRKSVEFFVQMRNFGLVPNSFTYVGVLVGVGGLGDSILSQSVHGLVVKSGWESNLIVTTAMFDAYAKCGSINDSLKIFQGIRAPGLVSWNAMIAGLLCNELFEEAFEMFNQLRRYGLVPNDITVLGLIQTCVTLDSRPVCESVHGLVAKFGFLSNTSVNNLVLSMYSSLLHLSAAIEVFHGIGCKDIISWTTMMALLARLERASDVVKLFCEMINSGISYDPIALVSIISACGLLGGSRLGRSVHAQAVINGLASELPLLNSMIVMYSRCADMDSAKFLFDQMTVKSLVSWTSMISGCVQNERPSEALDFFKRLRAEMSFSIDLTTSLATVAAAGELAALDLCEQLHCFALKAGFLYHRSMHNSFISVYSKCGHAELADAIFKQMGSLRDVVSWNALISGYGINGQGRTAVSLFHKMREEEEDPDGATYLSVLSACSHSGLINDGIMIISQMVEENRSWLSQKHYGCIADLLARAGYLYVTSELMEALGPKVWKALLNGCLLHCNVELAEVAARKLSERGMMEPGQAVLLSNLYSLVGRFTDAETLRLATETSGLIKSPGFSYISANRDIVG